MKGPDGRISQPYIDAFTTEIADLEKQIANPKSSKAAKDRATIRLRFARLVAECAVKAEPGKTTPIVLKQEMFVSQAPRSPETDVPPPPPPSTETKIPWVVVGVAAAGAIGLGLLIRNTRRRKTT